MTQVLSSIGVKDTVVFYDKKDTKIHIAKCNWFVSACPYLKHLTACCPSAWWTFGSDYGYVTNDGGKSFMLLLAYINVHIETDGATNADKILAPKKFCATCKYNDGKTR